VRTKTSSNQNDGSKFGAEYEKDRETRPIAHIDAALAGSSSITGTRRTLNRQSGPTLNQRSESQVCAFTLKECHVLLSVQRMSSMTLTSGGAIHVDVQGRGAIKNTHSTEVESTIILRAVV